MKHIAKLGLIFLSAAALGACGRPASLFAERSVPVEASPSSADGAPRYVGAWARSIDQCAHPWVIKARSIQAGGSDCDFDKVDSNSAGYAVAAVCHAPGGLNPVRLIIVTPNEARITSMTISGGPFTDAVPLERCSAQ